MSLATEMGLKRNELPVGKPWLSHLLLAKFNAGRLSPQVPTGNWRVNLAEELKYLTLESEVLEQARMSVAVEASAAPKDPQNFMNWFGELRVDGPGQNDPLFPWLAERATLEQMTWFIQQEVAGEAGFEDLAALAQLKLPARSKLEVARNYWDEMGRGHERGMHGPMLARAASELGIHNTPLEQIVPEALALANTLLGLAMHRRYAYHIIGALGVIELTSPDRSHLVYKGLRRLGLSAEAQRYYLLHSTIDEKHSEAWNSEVLLPLVQADPSVGKFIAEGALMRLSAGERCFNHYRRELWGFHM